jgi:hypothetical protein
MTITFISKTINFHDFLTLENNRHIRPTANAGGGKTG